MYFQAHSYGFEQTLHPCLLTVLVSDLIHGSLHRIMHNMTACFLPSDSGVRLGGGGETKRETETTINPFVT